MTLKICPICDGLLQDRGQPLHFSTVHRVWSCVACVEILKGIPAMVHPPKEST